MTRSIFAFAASSGLALLSACAEMTPSQQTATAAETNAGLVTVTPGAAIGSVYAYQEQEGVVYHDRFGRAYSIDQNGRRFYRGPFGQIRYIE